MKIASATRFLLPPASIAVTLLVLEGCFRLLAIQAEYHTPRRDEWWFPPGVVPKKVEYGWYSHGVVRSIYDSDPRGYFGPKNQIDHYLNDVGWRDLDHSVDKPPGTYRILGLGDSFLWGQGVRREDICLTKLEDRLNAGSLGVRVETINTGVIGINTVEERDLLAAVGLHYRPDLIIVHFVLNDVEDRSYREGPRVDFFKEYTSIYQQPDRLSDVSRLWGWVRQRYLQTVRARAYVATCVSTFKEENESWKACRAALSDIQEISRRNGVDLLVVIFPYFYDLDKGYPFQGIHDAVRTYCRTEGIPVLDLLDSYPGFHGPELWAHPTDQHPNEIAHAIAAAAIERWLVDHQTIENRLRGVPR